MGFFKSIGKSLKKVVNLKTLVKTVGAVASVVPIGGKLVQKGIDIATKAVNARAKQKEAEKQKDYQAAHDAKLIADALEQQAKQLGVNAVQTASASTAQMLSGAVVDGALQGVSQSAVNGLGNLGSQVVDSTLKQWFKKNWMYLTGGLVALLALIWFMRRGSNNSSRARRR
ncbi:hypothetical protein [Flavobacterium salmonis]|uniref:Uncharacterized protein n=1 Tax=Flavobacterium salmonis TaxID=2654844 RepID=A0A6V6Z484_9FLAO|nr:hypothetical protein [Flavobacterium salmonis]CAD0006563.1 hypothetical protein FLAT13_03346 [Flavobacterium salmonis]